MVPIVKLLSLASAKHWGSGLESNEHTELTCQAQKGPWQVCWMCCNQAPLKISAIHAVLFVTTIWRQDT